MPLTESLPWLTMHAAGAVVLDRNPSFPLCAPSATAPGAPLGIHASLGWSSYRTAGVLLQDPHVDARYGLLKMRGSETLFFRWGLRLGQGCPRAAVVRQLQLPATRRTWVLPLLITALVFLLLGLLVLIGEMMRSKKKHAT